MRSAGEPALMTAFDRLGRRRVPSDPARKTSQNSFCHPLLGTHRSRKKSQEPSTINVAVQESEPGIVFLRKIVKGGTDKSYGIHVAKLAGLPTLVLSAQKPSCKNSKNTGGQKPRSAKDKQLSLFSSPTEDPKLEAENPQYRSPASHSDGSS